MAVLLKLKLEGTPAASTSSRRVRMFPWTDLTASGESLVSRAEADPMGLKNMAALYHGRTDAGVPFTSPLFADLSGLPPLLVQVGDAEILLNDALEQAGRFFRAQVFSF